MSADLSTVTHVHLLVFYDLPSILRVSNPFIIQPFNAMGFHSRLSSTFHKSSLFRDVPNING